MTDDMHHHWESLWCCLPQRGFVMKMCLWTWLLPWVHSSAAWHKTGGTEECAVMERWIAGSRPDNNEGLLFCSIMGNITVLYRYFVFTDIWYIVIVQLSQTTLSISNIKEYPCQTGHKESPLDSPLFYFHQQLNSKLMQLIRVQEDFKIEKRWNTHLSLCQYVVW